jgi:hypothetical protein
MLNKCKCGENAKLKWERDRGWFVECCAKFCFRSVDGDDSRDAVDKWNNPPPTPVTPPEDFEDRFEKAFKGICQLLHDDVDDDELLPEFESHFGFDLKEVAKEQWTKHKGN